MIQKHVTFYHALMERLFENETFGCLLHILSVQIHADELSNIINKIKLYIYIFCHFVCLVFFFRRNTYNSDILYVLCIV